jgi:DNA-binding CsgD family transcriptional regulator
MAPDFSPAAKAGATSGHTMAAGMKERVRASRLIERGVELSVLSSVVEAAAAGRGGVVVIGAAAGMGKTSLVDAAAQMAAERRLGVLRARGMELETGYGYGIVRQLFERPLAELRGGLRSVAGAARLATAAVAGDLDPGLPTADPHAVLNGLYWVAVDMSRQSGVVICVDDAHWADEASLRWLAYLASRIDDEHIAVVAAARTADMREGIPAVVLDALLAADSTASVRPGPLSEDGALEMVRRATLPDAEAAFAKECHRLTGGNPLLIQELLRAVTALGIVPRTESLAMLRKMAPEAISSPARRRMSRLSEVERAVAEAVAILEPRCDLRSVAALAEVDVDRCAASLDALAAKEILTQESLPTFVHPVIREATLSALCALERSRRHLRAAKLLAGDGAPTEIVATHLLDAYPAQDGWVVETLLQSGAEAASHGAPDAAVVHLRRALGEPPPPQRRGDVLLALGRAEFQAELPEATGHLREAMESAADPGSRAQAALLLGNALVASGDAAAAEQVATAVRDHVPAEAELQLALEAILLAAQTMLRLPPRIDHRLAELSRPLTGATASERYLLSRIAQAKAALGEHVEDVLDLAFRCLKDGRLELDQQLFGGLRPAYVLMVCDELDRAEALLARFLEQARQAGMLPWIGLGSVIRAMISIRRGEVGLAETSALDSLAVSDQRSFAFWIPMALSALASAQLERGAASEASQRLSSTPPPPQLAGTWVMGYLHHARGRVNLAGGDLSAALTEFEAAGESLLSHGFTNPSFIEWRSDAARARTLLGDCEGAAALAAEELRLARAFGAPRAIGVALRGLAAVSSDDRLTLLEEATSTLGHTQARLDHAHALLELGAARRREGQRTAARERLVAAQELGRRCGSALVTDRATEELEALGVRRPRSESRDLNALTPSEERVARMAAGGMTNREIAEALYVTPKTVDTHLYHVYAKLGISSRRQLSKLLQLPNR